MSLLALSGKGQNRRTEYLPTVIARPWFEMCTHHAEFSPAQHSHMSSMQVHNLQVTLNIAFQPNESFE